MSRHREKSKGQKTAFLTERYRTSVPVGSWTNGTPYGTTKFQHKAVMNDIVTPQYFQRIKSGEIITSPMDFTDTTVESIGAWSYSRRGGVGDLTYEVPYQANGSLYDWAIQAHFAGDGGNPVVPSTASRESASIARAKQKALASVDKTPVSIGQDIAEIRQSLELIRNPLSFIGKRTSDYQRKASLLRETVKRKARLDAQLRDLFLTYQYGVAPLWRSVMSVVGEISQPKIRDTDKILAAHGSDTVQDNWSGTLTRSAIYTQPWKRDWSFEARATVLYRINNPVEDWRSRFGLRLKDLPVIIWEVQSLSFMIDRIFDVRSGIKGLMNFADPSISIIQDKCSYSVRKSVVDERTLNMSKPAGWSVHNVSFDRKVVTTYTYSRSPWTASVADVIPRENFRGLIDSATKTAELLALIHSGLGVGGRRI